MQNAYDTIGQYYNRLKPYMDTGEHDLSSYSSLAHQLSDDPTGFYNNIMNQYKMSPGAQEQMGYLQDQTANAAAKGGYLGTPNEQMDLSNQLQRLIDQDQQQYYGNVMQPFQLGYQGLSNDAAQGLRATNQYGDMLANQASIDMGKQKMNMGMLGSMLGPLAGGLGKALGPQLMGLFA